MLESIVTSKARVRLLLRFFLNPEVKAYLRELSTEFGGSSNAVRVELNRLVDARLLKIERSGRNKFYSANVDHPLFPEIHSISRKMTGLDKVHKLMSEVGNLESAYITGDYARGMDSGVIDLLLVGELDHDCVHKFIDKIEEVINRKIRPLLLTQAEMSRMNGKFKTGKMLLLWGSEPTN